VTQSSSSPAQAQAEARTAGFAYLATIAAGLFAEVYVRSSVRAGDFQAIGDRLQEFEQLYRVGVLADGVMLVSYVIVTAMLYRLFKPFNATASVLAALFSLVGVAMLAAAMPILLLPIQMDGASVAYDALRAHSAAFNLTGLFFGPCCAVIGWMIIRSGWLPAWIGWLMLAAGAAFVFDAAVELTAPSVARRIPEGSMLISLIAEGSLAVWLAAFGVQRAGRRAAA
jgi:hypothetical protein